MFDLERQERFFIDTTELLSAGETEPLEPSRPYVYPPNSLGSLAIAQGLLVSGELKGKPARK